MRRIFVDVDVQFDFCDPKGALYVKGSPNDQFVRLTKHAIERRIPVLGSVDSHAFDAWEFASNDNKGPGGAKPNFPDHCVKGTRGWLKLDGTLPSRFRFVPNVPTFAFEGVVDELSRGAAQGVYFEKEVYSMFANPIAEPFLAALAKKLGEPVELVVYGVATDYCVKAAALGLRERGYATTVLTDAIAGITPEGTKRAIEAMESAGARLATVASVIA